MVALIFAGLNFSVEALVRRQVIPSSDPNCPHQLYIVGMASPAQFNELYRSCYDPITVTTKYTQHIIYTTSSLTGCVGGNWRTSKIITGDQESTMRRTHILVVTDPSFPTYDRGHLAACADFPTLEERKASLEIINSVPQLSSLNQGQWKSMEFFLQQRGSVRGVNVVTGGLGVLQYQGRHVYLYRGYGNPIPEFIYKVARVRGATHDVLYAFGAFNHGDSVDPLRLATYCNTNTSCPLALTRVVCCEPIDFINRHLPAFTTFFGI